MRQKSSTQEEHRCWVVKWRWSDNNRPPLSDFFQLLPFRWSSKRVRDYVKALYANFEYVDRMSALGSLKNTKSSRQFWNSRLRDDGFLISTSTNPALEAQRVTDLTVEYDREQRKEILRWTRPMRVDFVEYPTGSRLEPIGEPIQESYERICPFLPTVVD
jgi:hypothetical protein